MPAADVARLLAARFLANGNYETGPVFLGAQQPAGAILDQYFDVEAGFSGLAVQSVGYTAGADQEKVVIHVTRGSRRAFSLLPQQVADAEVEIDIVGKFRAAPAIAGPSYFYERGGRIACGSSCGLGKFTGTFGALLRNAHNLLALSNNHVFGGCNHTTRDMPVLSPSSGDS